jgi:predicted Ser/Thr protein kinase
MPKVIGQTLLDQFRVEEFIASGGMGAVYRVWDLKRNVPLAMKVLHAELADDPAMFQRFQREANALRKLAHPNIVPFYGLFQTEDFDFMLERFIDGPSLQAILKKRKGPLPVEEALVYLKALCAALGYAHASGVVHCDVKPGNVMVDHGGSVYLTDFGIVRHSESTTTTMGAAGTPAYMAPEQIRGEPVSPATDIYSLGVLLYEMLSGQRPFRGNEAGTEQGGTTANERIRYGHLNLPPPDPRSINPAIPVELASVIFKALSKNPQDRFASTLDLFNAICLQAGQTAMGIADHVTLPPSYAREEAIEVPLEVALNKQIVTPGDQPIGRDVSSYERRTPWLAIGGAVVCMLLIGGIILISGQGQPRPAVVPDLPSPTTVLQTVIGTQPPVFAPLPAAVSAGISTPTLPLAYSKAHVDQVNGDGASVEKGQYLDSGKRVDSGSSGIQISIGGQTNGLSVLYLFPNTVADIVYDIKLAPVLENGSLYIEPEDGTGEVYFSTWNDLVASVSGSRMIVEIIGNNVWIYCFEGICRLDHGSDSKQTSPGYKQVYHTDISKWDDQKLMDDAELSNWSKRSNGYINNQDLIPTPTLPLSPKSTLTPTPTKKINYSALKTAVCKKLKAANIKAICP